MTQTRFVLASILLLASQAVAWAGEGGRAGWAKVAEPTEGPSEVVGSYANGCLLGGVALPEEGPGFQTIRRAHNRFWAHPSLKVWLDAYGQRLQSLGINALVADVAQPRGGPMPSGHGSHQVGLDMDIWLRPGPLPSAELFNPKAYSVVQPDGQSIDPESWTPQMLVMLREAAKAPGVERIFVNAAIKRHLCQTLPPDDRDWLGHVRPWWGHDAHFHVRLSCPADSPDCQKQEPVPSGDGCGASLDWWFTEEALHPAPKPVAAGPKKLPDRCRSAVDVEPPN